MLRRLSFALTQVVICALVASAAQAQTVVKHSVDARLLGEAAMMIGRAQAQQRQQQVYYNRQPTTRTVFVSPHVRSDGAVVPGHFRTAPDGNFSNNWSTSGNVNPVTGDRGTRQYPDSYGSTSYSGPGVTGVYFVPSPFYTPAQLMGAFQQPQSPKVRARDTPYMQQRRAAAQYYKDLRASEQKN